MYLEHPTFNTKACDELCRNIAKKSNGVCFLAFSRGKDSVCAWLQLRRYFHRIIPVHCCEIPHMPHVDAALDYYEEQFGEHILRMQSPQIYTDMKNLVYQLPHDEEFLDNWRVNDAHTLKPVFDHLRYLYKLPRAWVAFGINMSDSMQRRIFVKQRQGMAKESKNFYPCWDWSHDNIISTIEESGLKLAPEYNFVNRTIDSTPNVRWLEPFRKAYPKGYEKLERWFPLAWADVVRMEYRHEQAVREAEKRGGNEERKQG